MEHIDPADNIITHMAILGGKPVIKGTRVPVTLVIEELAGGTTGDELMKEYDLTHAQVQAALKYAAMALKEDVVMVA